MAFLCPVSTVCVPLHENVLFDVHEFSLIPNFCAKFFIFKVCVSYRRVTKRNYHSSLLLSILLYEKYVNFCKLPPSELQFIFTRRNVVQQEANIF